VLLGLAIFVGFGVGPVGEWLDTGTRMLVGRAVAIMPLVLVAVGIATILAHPLMAAQPLRLGLIIGMEALLVALAAGLMGFDGAERTAWFDPETMQGRGGVLGEAGYWATSHTVGSIGTALLVIVGLIAAVLLITGASLGHGLRRSGRGAAAASRNVSRGVATATVTALRTADRLRERPDAGEAPTLAGRRRPLAGRKNAPLVDGADAFSDLFDEAGDLPPSPALVAEALEVDEPAAGSPSHPEVPADGASPPAGAGDDQGADRTRPGRRPARARMRPLPDADHGGAELAPLFRPTDEPTPDAQGYVCPSIGLLTRTGGTTEQPREVIERTSRLLEETLGHFGITANVADTTSGPRVTRYELQLAPGTKVGRITSLRDDLAYALAAREELRILAPIPGKQAVGVEVPNPEASLVTLGDITREFPASAGPLMAWLGLDLSGKPVYIDLAKMPHLLIAGSTGTGKSVCLNSILASILLRSTPANLRMILIDPKKVELNHYESIPHLLTPVVTNMKDASAVLGNVVREMESRYELMGMARARNLRDWNEVREAQGETPIPTILVVIDELADLMMVSPAEVEDSIIRLAQKSRAVGIHLVLATQRPSADVITGMIKANVPSRIAFAVSSQVDSRVILDSGGAESLLGHGDMLFRPVGTSRLQRLQGAYVSEEEIKEITDHWRGQGKPVLRRELLERAEPEEDPLDVDGDDMLGRAIEMVVQQGTASVSLLQRRLGVGYARAGRLVDSMERLGVVSGHEGSKPRTVLVGEGDLDRLLRRAPAGTDESEEVPAEE
jgi:S-DNA-T family DNA segregation ATPase FtsK/SpoIIIE